jgi:hypothetical protein
MSKPDYFYFNANYTNTDLKTIEAEFQSDSSEPIISNPSEYDMSIIRFTCPGSFLPLFIFKPQTYYVSLAYQGIVSDHSAGEVKYINIRDGLPTSNPLYYYVNDYNQFITAINKAYTSAYNSLAANCTACGVTLPTGTLYGPFVTINTDINKLRITTQVNSYLATDPYALWPNPDSNAIEIWCNLALAQYLSAFQIIVRTSFSNPANPSTDWSNATTYALNATVNYNGTA